jgi:hypothetical protein
MGELYHKLGLAGSIFGYNGKKLWSAEMCAERLWYVIMAILMGLVMGFAGSQMFVAAFLVQLGIMIIFLMRGFTGFCPSVIMLKQLLPSCEKEQS